MTTKTAELIAALRDRISALPESRQLMVLYLLVGSNPEDVARELDQAQQVWDAPPDGLGPEGTGNTRDDVAFFDRMDMQRFD